MERRTKLITKVMKRKKEKIELRRNWENEENIPVKYANVNELICAILLIRAEMKKLFNHANGHEGENQPKND